MNKTQTINIWSAYTREDLSLSLLMRSKGWSYEFDERDVEANSITPQNPPVYHLTFLKGGCVAEYDNRIQLWTVSDITNDGFQLFKTRQRHYTSIEKLLANEN